MSINQIPGIALLSQFTVDESSEFQISRILDICDIDQPGTQGRGAVAILDAQVGAVPILQVIANGIVVGDAIAGHMLQGTGTRDLSGLASDDHRQFAFVMHELHARGPASQPAVAQQGARTFEEHQGLVLGVEGQFLGVIGVIQAQRNDGAGGEGRQPNHVPGGNHPAVLQHQGLVSGR